MTVMSLKSSTILCGVLALLPWCALAQCDANSVYAAFKQYREQVNSATHLEQLSPYFSTTFNQYYTAKLASEKGSTRYLTHYWDNLNTAQDIVIVYDYAVRCSGKENNQATLTLLAILNQPSTTPQPQVDLWMVKIHYVKEDQQWLIESFEYDKSRSNEVFEENQIVDNFAVIR